MLSSAIFRETSTGLSKSSASKLHKTIRKQPFPITSPTSDKTLNIPIKNSQSAQARKRKNDAAKSYQTKVSPRSLSSSLTSEIPCFDLNSFHEVGSSTSASNNQLISQKSSFSSSCKPMINFSPVLQPCEDPLAELQLSQHQSQFIPQSTETFTRIDSPARLLNWNLLPSEIQKAVVDLNGQVDELQLRFDEYVPFIEAPLDSRFALQKVIEAQRFQQSQIFKLANLKEGVSLESAVDTLINQGNIFTSNKKEKDIQQQVKKSQKIRKDSHVKNNENSLRPIQREQHQQIGKSDLEDKNNNLLFRENGSKLQTGMILSTIQEKEFQGQFSGNHLHHQQAVEQGMQFRYPNHGNMMSPRKAVYDDDLMTQPEFIGVQQMNNQYDDFNGVTKLRRHQSDPFGYSYFNQQGYINSMSCNPHHVPFKNQMDPLEGELSMVYEEDSIFEQINHHQQLNNQHQQVQLELFKKDDEEDTLNRAYHSQNDTFEDLIDSQSKCNCNQQNGNKSNQLHEFCCSSEPNLPMASQNYNNTSFLNDSSPYHLHQSNNPHSFQAALHHSYPATQEFYSNKPFFQQQQIRREFDFPQDTQYTNQFGRTL